MSGEKIVYSKRTGKRRPPSNVTERNEPNLELMARAIINLYESTKKGEIMIKKKTKI
ncbi:hypothetical protein QFZ28_004334 [Neobacillus niacini]|uniref:hypothetical protein n=1 Tax=Neobacillus niacini TaxID=86668 RepID=UPI00277D7098|nr:hypothetical protein [Neobacillus niacini]MDQ1003934.1 hypothetical protein [Neobacillus niacini]